MFNFLFFLEIPKICFKIIIKISKFFTFTLLNIVSPAAFEPLPGWVDNLNGPTGLMIGCGKGVIRSVLVDEKNKSEVIPVDYAINGLIVIPYEFNKGKK